jgi:hypothetical protein
MAYAVLVQQAFDAAQADTEPLSYLTSPEYSPRSLEGLCLGKGKCSRPGKIGVSNPLSHGDQGVLSRCMLLAGRGICRLKWPVAM